MIEYGEVLELARRMYDEEDFGYDVYSAIKAQPRLEGEAAVRVERWVRALRSEYYRQTNRQLCDSAGFSCLGVYAEAVDRIPIYDLRRAEESYLCSAASHVTTFPAHHRLETFFAKLNDETKASFEQIADIAEALLLNGRPSDKPVRGDPRLGPFTFRANGEPRANGES